MPVQTAAEPQNLSRFSTLREEGVEPVLVGAPAPRLDDAFVVVEAQNMAAGDVQPMSASATSNPAAVTSREVV